MPSISDYIQDLNHRIFLPGLQREFVWSEKQTENLFDSLIREYPVGLITRWDVAHSNADYYPYKFIRNYADDDRAIPDPVNEEGFWKYNEEADEENVDLSYLVIDGQQRLTSLFIGLFGKRLKYTTGRGGRRENINDWSSYELCINLLGHPDFDGENLAGDYEFEFRRTDDYDANHEFGYVESSDGTQRYWFPLPKMMNENREVRNARELRRITEETLNDVNLTEDRRNELLDIRSEVIPKVESRILDATLPNKDVKKSSSEIKEIFQRINVEGEDPDPHQLLMSRMMSTWPFTEPEEKQINPRKKTKEWVQSYQEAFEEYDRKIDRELFMRYSVYLINDVLKTQPVSNLSDNELLTIRGKWLKDGERFSTHDTGDCQWFCYSLDAALKSVTTLGFTRKTMSTMPMIAALAKFYYYNPDADPEDTDNLQNIYRFLSKLLLLKSSKGSLGRVEATRLSNFLHENMDRNYSEFPEEEAFSYIFDYLDIEIGEDTVRNIVENAEYDTGTRGRNNIFTSWDVAAILNLSTPAFEYADVDNLEVDHIFPASRSDHIERQVDLDEDEEFNIHRIGNLQLLPKEVNRQKNDELPRDWLDTLSDTERAQYKRVNSFPNEFPVPDNYQEFVTKREKSLIEEVTQQIKS
ncbi:DUF262 domain-containing protein [Natrinema hispanicum]|uniref:DUF262 domain-containing protein n=1 Tax=Natrinema hispanicum TaxID=392421 RepID=A0A1H9YNY0_9EURY|nr:DUF262 domain-containing protein [Natrinema hispanicum]SES70775.1 Protein of unknown function [Natrinema hispanicum]